MSQEQFVSIQKLCWHFKVEVSFIDAINQMGLIQIEVIEQSQFIHVDEISNLEKIIRLHNELNVNLEGIDVVLNLLEKEQKLRDELNTLKNRLRRYEND